jgi:hypothetical protein
VDSQLKGSRLDRVISMATYTADVAKWVRDVADLLGGLGPEKLGVGLERNQVGVEAGGPGGVGMLRSLCGVAPSGLDRMFFDLIYLYIAQLRPDCHRGRRQRNLMSDASFPFFLSKVLTGELQLHHGQARFPWRAGGGLSFGLAPRLRPTSGTALATFSTTRVNGPWLRRLVLTPCAGRLERALERIGLLIEPTLPPGALDWSRPTGAAYAKAYVGKRVLACRHQILLQLRDAARTASGPSKNAKSNLGLAATSA